MTATSQKYFDRPSAFVVVHSLSLISSFTQRYLPSQAETLLQSMETQAGFYALLLEVSCRQEVPLHTRMLAVMFFKNRIDRFWRNRDNSITDAEKGQLDAPHIDSESLLCPQTTLGVPASPCFLPLAFLFLFSLFSFFLLNDGPRC